MTETLARAVAARVWGRDAGEPRRLASGRSCDAYVVHVHGTDHVVRVPAAGTDRSIRFCAEAALGEALSAAGHPVARWTVVEVEGTDCVVGPRLPGAPVASDGEWSAAFTAALGRLLADLHALPATGFGPLADSAGALRGDGGSVRDGVLRRWCWARCWPFDDPDLTGHPLTACDPAAAAALEARTQHVLDAADGPLGVVHSDLHREHLLAGPKGDLTGVLDFGDAFVGSPAWDVALLHWYYGPQAARDVARHHPLGQDLVERAWMLVLAVGAYKLAKNPADPQVPVRLARALGSL